MTEDAIVQAELLAQAEAPHTVARVTPLITTGLPTMDRLLGGGLPRGALSLIMGLPGSGKTTLASQIACAAVKTGKRALILTALSESTTKLIAHLSAFSFFDPTTIGGPLRFLSLQGSFSAGLEAMARDIFREARRSRADIVVLDGFRGLPAVQAEPQVAREFLYTLSTALGMLNISTLVTSEADPRDPTFFPETTTADVIVGLHYTLLGVRQTRSIEILKSRGAAPLPGLHALTLTGDGAAIFPQLEERVGSELLGGDAQSQGDLRTNPEIAAPTRVAGEAAFGLSELDRMLNGGLPRATCSLIVGNLGTGKTLLGLRYALAGVQRGERVVYLGFRESRAQLLRATAPFTLGPEYAQALLPGGPLTFLEVPPIKVHPDILADRLLAQLDQVGAELLVIDSIAEVEQAILRSQDPGRMEDYFGALLVALRARQITTLLIKETDKAIGTNFEFAADRLSMLAENVILLQQIAYAGHLHRILSILKLRFSAHETALSEVRIRAPEGIQVMRPTESAPGVLEGITSLRNSG